MDISETDLPGVGKRFEVDIGGGKSTIVVVHNTGPRELFVRPDPDADAEELLKLSDRDARVIGSILEGAHVQPVVTDSTATQLAQPRMIVLMCAFFLQIDSFNFLFLPPILPVL